MKINIDNAIKKLLPNPSLEMVYAEAVANSFDADADFVEIKISIDSFSDEKSLQIEIKDNGKGFIDENFHRFCHLFEIEDKNHKGLGRLIFLNYFEEIEIESFFENKQRIFSFSKHFDGNNFVLDEVNNLFNETTLKFRKYSMEKIYKYDYLRPLSIKKYLYFKFLPLFYSFKERNKNFSIKISLETKKPDASNSFYSDTQTLSVSDLPILKEISLEDKLDLFSDLKLRYSILEKNNAERNIITAICVDHRMIELNFLSQTNIPTNYEIIFLLISEHFTGKSDDMRENLDIEEFTKRKLLRIFQENVTAILDKEIPVIREKNQKVFAKVQEQYPHLIGFFNEKNVGLIEKTKILEEAQTKFFKKQREVLEATHLDDEKYESALNISSRVLTEYILYRNLIINKLKQISEKNSEAEIHNIIVPKRKICEKSNFVSDLYSNNAWLLDDKYMSYSTILSEQEMGKLLENIALASENVKKDLKRPDIAIVFSNDVRNNQKTEVVVVELKKIGIKLAEKEEVISQLKQRARKLLQYYPNKIQRIWFYGIVDIDDEFKTSLIEDRYADLFSNDSVFYKTVPIIVDLKTRTEIPVGIYIMSFEAFFKDAEDRNKTFLTILKESLK